jgi:hypothetical protein
MKLIKICASRHLHVFITAGFPDILASSPFCQLASFAPPSHRVDECLTTQMAVKKWLGVTARKFGANMLDRYEGTLFCVVNYNDGSFAECDIVDAVAFNTEVSIDDGPLQGTTEILDEL